MPTEPSICSSVYSLGKIVCMHGQWRSVGGASGALPWAQPLLCGPKQLTLVMAAGSVAARARRSCILAVRTSIPTLRVGGPADGDRLAARPGSPGGKRALQPQHPKRHAAACAVSPAPPKALTLSPPTAFPLQHSSEAQKTKRVGGAGCQGATGRS